MFSTADGRNGDLLVALCRCPGSASSLRRDLAACCGREDQRRAFFAAAHENDYDASLELLATLENQSAPTDENAIARLVLNLEDMRQFDALFACACGAGRYQEFSHLSRVYYNNKRHMKKRYPKEDWGDIHRMPNDKLSPVAWERHVFATQIMGAKYNLTLLDMEDHGDRSREVALMRACENGHLDIAKGIALLHPRQSLEELNYTFEALRRAVAHGHLDVVVWLAFGTLPTSVDYEFSVNYVTGEQVKVARRALKFAWKYGQPDIAVGTFFKIRTYLIKSRCVSRPFRFLCREGVVKPAHIVIGAEWLGTTAPTPIIRSIYSHQTGRLLHSTPPSLQTVWRVEIHPGQVGENGRDPMRAARRWTRCRPSVSHRGPSYPFWPSEHGRGRKPTRRARHSLRSRLVQ